MNKKEAREVITQFGSKTSFFNNCEYTGINGESWNMTQDEMREMLRYKMCFGQAETECIIAAIVIAGGLKK